MIVQTPVRTTSPGQRGFSLIEMIIAVAATTIVLLVVMSMIEEAARVSLFVESHNDLATLSQRPLNQIQREVLQERYVFQEDAIGTPYRQAVEAKISANSALPQVAANSLLPVFNTAASTMAPDDAGGTRYTGNAILVAKQLAPGIATLASETVNGVPYPQVNYAYDRYLFEYYYLSRNTSRKFREGGYVLDLVRYKSIQFADYFQLVNSVATLSANQKTSLATQIKAGQNYPDGTVKYPPIATAWNPGQPYASAFYTIPADLGFTNSNLVASPALTMASIGSVIPELNRGRIGGRMTYTVAYRLGASPGTPISGMTGRNPVPKYADVTSTSLPNDCGFEVKVVGATGARQALARLVLYSAYGVGATDSQEAVVITSFSR